MNGDALQNYERLSQSIAEYGRVLNSYTPNYATANTSGTKEEAEAPTAAPGSFLEWLDKWTWWDFLNPKDWAKWKEYWSTQGGKAAIASILFIIALILLYLALQPQLDKLPSINVPAVPGV